ncbi:MAG: erythromycin esterase family protein [Chloroflexota bacterium]
MTQLSAVEQELAERDAALAQFVKQHANPLPKAYLSANDPLLDMIGAARIVMIGDGSHGTHEFYRERALITKRLIEEKGFNHVGLEVPKWPEVSPLNQYVRDGAGTAWEALGLLEGWATWTWGNLDMQHFMEWLRRYNTALPNGQPKVGFLGIDVHGFPATDPVLHYLDTVNPLLARIARERYSGFERFGGDHYAYGYYAGTGIVESCERQAAEVVRDLQANREDLISASNQDAYFDALMAALAVKSCERYHRAMFFGGENAWNIRDIHMQETLDAVLDHSEGAKVVVWAHNAHVGDFRAAGKSPGINLGQLTRQRRPGEMVSVGFGQCEGSVTAARGWNGPAEHMAVPPGIPGSYDNVFHQTGLDRFLLLLRPLRDSLHAGPLDEWRGNRSLGVVYNPAFDLPNYTPTKLASRYDAFVHIDRTQAVKPLDLSGATLENVSKWEAEIYPEGY